MIVLMTVLSLVACSNDDDDDSSSSDTETTDTETTESEGSDNMSDIRIEELGSFDDEAEIVFTVKPDDVSVIFTARSASPESTVVIGSVIGPDGEPLYESNLFELFEQDIEDEEELMNRMDVSAEVFNNNPLFNNGEISFFLPGAPRFPIQSGEYRVLLRSESEIAEARAVFRTGDVDAPQAIDFNILWLTQEGTKISENIRTEFSEAVRSAMDGILNPHDLSVGKIEIFDATEKLLSRFSEFNQDQDEEILALDSEATEIMGAGRAINIALVDVIVDAQGDSGYGGVAFGAPGDVFNKDAYRSFVLASWEAYGTEYVMQGANLLHEASHYMSLNHPTEREGKEFDIFEDTPECRAEIYDTNQDGEMDDYECGIEGGAKNYLFWSGIEEFTPFDMSGEQAWKLRRHPLFHPVEP